MNYYFDTCIWRDYYENRSDNYRPLGDWALALIKKIQKEGGIIFYSSVVFRELKKEYSLEQIEEMFSAFISILQKVEYNFYHVQEAKILNQIRNIGFSDALHAVLARDNAAILITRDEHFIDLVDIVTIKKPEELI